MDGEKISSALNATHLPGLKFVTQPFIPVSGLYAGRRCGGVGIRVGDRAAVRAMNMGLEIAGLLQKVYPQDFDASKTIVLLGNSDTVQKLKAAHPLQTSSQLGNPVWPTTTRRAATISSINSSK